MQISVYYTFVVYSYATVAPQCNKRTEQRQNVTEPARSANVLTSHTNAPCRRKTLRRPTQRKPPRPPKFAPSARPSPGACALRIGVVDVPHQLMPGRLRTPTNPHKCCGSTPVVSWRLCGVCQGSKGSSIWLLPASLRFSGKSPSRAPRKKHKTLVAQLILAPASSVA